MAGLLSAGLAFAAPGWAQDQKKNFEKNQPGSLQKARAAWFYGEGAYPHPGVCSRALRQTKAQGVRLRNL